MWYMEESCQTFMVEVFCQKSYSLLAKKHFFSKKPWQMFDWFLITSLIVIIDRGTNENKIDKKWNCILLLNYKKGGRGWS